MTKRLYYEDAYCREFSAVVTGCEPAADGWRVTLDRTAFYPEGGGQPADTGTLGGVRVRDVHEKAGEIWHCTDGPLAVGARAAGEIDWERRFSFMQHHTGEHIVSGILHRLYGVDNVGFHMGHDAVTIDLSAELSAEELRAAETLANRAVWENRPVEVSYPAPPARAARDYRSKKALSGEVRIVTVPGSDVCACCGIHCARTGEVGMVKLTAFQRYKGGVRVWLLCGERALADYDEKQRSVAAVSALLSAKPGEVAAAVSRLMDELSAQKQAHAALQNEYFALRADALASDGDVRVFAKAGLTPNDLRRFCLLLSERCGGVAAVFSSAGENGWRYALGSAHADVRPLCKRLNAAFAGRGGGTAELAQGSLTGARAALEAFFEEN